MTNTQKPRTRKLGRGAAGRTRTLRAMRDKKDERALNESEERFRSIAERSYDAIAAIDSEGRFTFVSPSIERITGHRPDELVGSQFRSFVSESEMPKVVHAFQSMMKGQDIEGLQLSVKKKDGSLVQIEVNGSPIRKNKRIVGMQGIIRDITERKKMENRLSSLHRHALAIASTNEMNEVIKNTLDAMEFTLGFEAAGFWVVDTARRALRLVGIRGMEISFSELPLDGPGLTVKAARLRRTIRATDVKKEPEYVDDSGRAGRDAPPAHLSELSVPVLVEGEAVAVLDVEGSKLEAFTETDQELLETLASHAAMAFVRLKRDEAISRSEENLRALFNATLDSVMLWNADGTILAANEVFAKTLHKKPEEIIGRYAYDLIPPDSAKRRKSIIDEVIRSGKPARFEDERNGVWFDNSIYPVFDAHGKIATIAIYARDITAQRKQDEMLKQQYSMLEGIINSGNTPIFSVDRQHRYTSFNRAHASVMKAIYGQEIEIGKSILEYMTVAEDREKAKRNLDRALAGEHLVEEAYSGEEERSRLYFEVSHDPIMTQDSVIIGVAVYVRDLTERKRADDALRESEQKLKAVVHGSPIPQFVIDRNHTVIYWNKALEEITEIKAEQVVGTTKQWSAFYGEPRPCMADLLVDGRIERISEFYAGKYAKSMLVADAYEATDYFTAMGKEGKWLHFTAAAIKDSEGNVIGAVETLEDITERKRAEEVLRRSEERFSRIFQATPDPVTITRLEDGVYLEVNKAFTTSTGFAREETVGRSSLPGQTGIWASVEDRGRFAKMLKENGEVFGLEASLRMKDGSTRFATLTARPIELGGESCVLTIAHDITERKRMEDEIRRYSEHLEELVKERTRALRESETKYRSLVENIPDVTWTTDRNGRTVFISPNVVRVEGYTPEEIYAGGASEWYVRVHPDDLHRVREAFDSLFTTGKMYDIEYRVQRKDGNWIWVQERAVATHEEGGVQYADGVYADITERKQAELALAESEKKYRQLVQFAQEGLYNYDVNAVVTFVNPFLSRMFGYAAEEMIGKSLLTFVDEQDVDMVKAQIERRRRGIADTYEVRHIRKDGSGIYVSVTASPIIGEDGKFAGGLALLTDITERRRLQAQLVESQRLAAIGETTTMIGHDLRNPLQAMTGTLYIAKRLMSSDEKEDRREAAGLLATIDGQIEYMDKIVSDLQDYARPVEADRVETHLPDLVKAIAASLKIPDDVEVSVDIEAKLSSVWLDPLLFRRVLTNLILNAVQAMPKGGKLTITGSRRDGSFAVAVQDTGVGIAQENLEKVFTPFFTTKAQGQGLGLAVCKRLTEAQGGTIEVASRVGGGSTFTLKIPTNQTAVAS